MINIVCVVRQSSIIFIDCFVYCQLCVYVNILWIIAFVVNDLKVSNLDPSIEL